MRETWYDRLNLELSMAKIDETSEPPVEVELIDIDDEEEAYLFV